MIIKKSYEIKKICEREELKEDDFGPGLPFLEEVCKIPDFF